MSLVDNVTSVPEETREEWSTTYRVRNLAMGIIGVVLNASTLVAVVQHRELTRFVRCALLSLVTTDLALMMTILVASIPVYTVPDSFTVPFSFLLYICMDCTALTSLVIALDRAAAVFLPVWHKVSSESTVKITVSLLTPWLLAVGACFTSLSTTVSKDLPRFPLSLMTFGGLLLQAMIFMGCGLGVLVAYTAMSVRLGLLTRVVVHPAFITAAGAGRESLTPSESRRSRRITVHLAFLGGWFCAIYIPFACYLLSLYAGSEDKNDLVAEFNKLSNLVMSNFAVVGSLVNPLFFFWRLGCARSCVNTVSRIVLHRRQLPDSSVRNIAPAAADPPIRIIELS